MEAASARGSVRGGSGRVRRCVGSLARFHANTAIPSILFRVGRIIRKPIFLPKFSRDFLEGLIDSIHSACMRLFEQMAAPASCFGQSSQDLYIHVILRHADLSERPAFPIADPQAVSRVFDAPRKR